MAIPSSLPATGSVVQANDPGRSAGPLGSLAAAIVTLHHGFLRRELPLIEALLNEGRRSDSPDFQQTSAALFPIFVRFRKELEGHLKREEATLFPLIERLERAIAAGQPAPHNSFGPLSNAIQFMNEDHDFGDTLLGRMAEISRGFTTPPGAHPQHAALMEKLAALQRDMVEHIRKEDEMLFPATIRLEESAR
jgi:regulator of cell morphogenesis and NO signaling